MRLHPFRALYPGPGRAADVVSPPYDVIDTAEARALAEGRPHSFLRVVRPEIDLPPGASIYSDEVYATGAANLARLQSEGVLVRDGGRAIWVYRLDMGDHTQVGFVGCAEVQDYADGRIKKHEFTRQDKEDDRTRHVDTLGAHTGPVFLTCHTPDGIEALQARLMEGEPAIDVTAHDGVQHRIWRIAEPDGLAAVATLLASVDAFYIADGHHRAASAWRTREIRRERQPDAGSDASFERFLTVLFPADQLQILPYNRILTDLNGRDSAGFLEDLEADFWVGPPGAEPTPPARNGFGLYLDGVWRRLIVRAEIARSDDPVDRLDVALLQDRLLGPILGIDDPRTSARLGFVGGIRGTDELERRVDGARQTGCAIAMYPTSITELLAVADAGKVMPPKSTWFEPKLASGLLVNLID
jgi:uncharacterized protein (DUF1015 family)